MFQRVIIDLYEIGLTLVARVRPTINSYMVWLVAGKVSENLIRVRMLACLLFRMDNGVANGDFVDATRRGDKGDGAYFTCVLIEDLFRQTGGFFEVASRSAEFDRYGHRLGHVCLP